MKSYNVTTATPGAMPVAQSTPLVVQAIGAGAGLFVVTVILGSVVAEMETARVLKLAAGLFCVPVLIVTAAGLCNVVEAFIERLTGRDLNNSGAIGDRPDIRLVPVRGSAMTVGGVEPEDWRYFVTTICATRDWTQATWRGRWMTSGRKCDNEYWELLTGHLKRIGVIVNAGPRATGELVESNPRVILEMLGLND
jgi:hypothetical protein